MQLLVAVGVVRVVAVLLVALEEGGARGCPYDGFEIVDPLLRIVEIIEEGQGGGGGRRRGARPKLIGSGGWRGEVSTRTRTQWAVTVSLTQLSGLLRSQGVGSRCNVRRSTENVQYGGL